MQADDGCWGDGTGSLHRDSVSTPRTWAARCRVLLAAVVLAIMSMLSGWITPGGPAVARADCCGMSGPIRQLTAVGDLLFFTAFDRRHGWELWRSDGTPRGTRIVKDIRPGSAGSGRACEDCEGGTEPNIMGVAGGALMLWASDGRHGVEPWRSDGTAKGTRMLRDIRPGPSGSLARDGDVTGATVGDSLYFGADDGTRHPSLWRTDGTAAGTTLVTDFASLADGPVVAQQLTPAVGGLYFTPARRVRPELWWSDGTAEGTAMVATSEDGAHFQDLVAIDGLLYFVDQGTDEPPSAPRLWRSDGTALGTTLVKDLGWIAESALVGDTLYLVVERPRWGELWRSDGTPERTVRLLRLDR